MKYSLLLLYLFFASFIVAGTLPNKEFKEDSSQSTWDLQKTNIYFDNDYFLGTDAQYTDGAKLSNLYFIPRVESSFLKIPFIHDDKKSHFVSLAVAQQIYTPDDTEESKLIIDDRPYAGWLYVEFGLHQSSETELDSLLVQLGMVGQASLAEQTQKAAHKIIKNENPAGWDNQLSNELGVKITYEHKWRYVLKQDNAIQTNIIPFLRASLGNVQTSAGSGVLIKYGWNPIQDFGSSPIERGGESGIPIAPNKLYGIHQPWSFTFNLALEANLIAQDIFLDGNTFLDSHSIEKENFLLNVSYGLSARYKQYALDFIITMSSKHFRKENSGHNFGTLLFSYYY